MKHFLLLITALIISSGLIGQTSLNNAYSRLGIGLIEAPGSVNHFGMGGLNSFQFEANAINLYNPASYSNLSKVVFQVAGKGNFSTISNSTTSTKFNGGQVQEIAMGFKKGGSKWGFAFGLTPYSSVGYSVTSTSMVNDSTQVIYKNDGSGGLNKFTIGATRSFRLYKMPKADTSLVGTAKFAADQRLKEKRDSLEYVSSKLNLGINLNVLFGSINNVRKVEYDNTRYFGTRATSRTSVNDIAIDAGFQYRKPISLKWDDKKVVSSTYLMVGGSYQLATNLKAKFDDIGEMYIYNNGVDAVIDTSYIVSAQNGTFALPERISLGVGMMHIGREGRMLTYGLEFRTQDWTKFSGTFQEELGAQSLGRYTYIGAGVEFTPNAGENSNLLGRTTYRVGARNTQTYINIDGNNITQQAVSAGFSMPIYASRTSSKFNFGIEYGNMGSTSDNLIQEQFVTIQVGFSLTPYVINPWFVQRRYD